MNTSPARLACIHRFSLAFSIQRGFLYACAVFASMPLWATQSLVVSDSLSSAASSVWQYTDTGASPPSNLSDAPSAMGLANTVAYTNIGQTVTTDWSLTVTARTSTTGRSLWFGLFDSTGTYGYAGFADSGGNDCGIAKFSVTGARNWSYGYNIYGASDSPTQGNINYVNLTTNATAYTTYNLAWTAATGTLTLSVNGQVVDTMHDTSFTSFSTIYLNGNTYGFFKDVGVRVGNSTIYWDPLNNISEINQNWSIASQGNAPQLFTDPAQQVYSLGNQVGYREIGSTITQDWTLSVNARTSTAQRALWFGLFDETGTYGYAGYFDSGGIAAGIVNFNTSGAAQDWAGGYYIYGSSTASHPSAFKYFPVDGVAYNTYTLTWSAESHTLTLSMNGVVVETLVDSSYTSFSRIYLSGNTYGYFNGLTLTQGNPQRNYHQVIAGSGADQWGAHTFQLLRSGANNQLTLAANIAGNYLFSDDAVIDGVTSITATWNNPANLAIYPQLTDQQGNIWQSTQAVTSATTPQNWLISTFTNYLQQSGNPPAFTPYPQNITNVGWYVPMDTTNQPTLSNCEVSYANSSTNNGTNNGNNNGTLQLFTDSPYVPQDYSPHPTQALNTAAPTANRTVPHIIVADDSRIMGLASSTAAWNSWSSSEFPGNFGVDMGTVLYAGLGNAVGSLRNNAAGGGPQFTIYEDHILNGRTAWAHNNSLYALREYLDQNNTIVPFSPDDNSYAWDTNDQNNTLTFDYSAQDETQPQVLAAIQDRMNAAYDLGFDSFQIDDYDWPYFGNDAHADPINWGYSPTAIQQFKLYLKGLGPQLSLVNPSQTMAFADYWASFSSIPLVPSSFGNWNTWDDFVPGFNSNFSSSVPYLHNQCLLFDALCRYHHLIFLSELGSLAQIRGKEFTASLNNDDFNNDCDVILMGRIASLSSIGEEFFGSPTNLIGYRHSLCQFQYASGGPYLDLIGEINQGGDTINSRYDLADAFAFYYDVAASCLPRNYNVQYQAGQSGVSTWAAAPPTTSPTDRPRFDHWYGGANAFMLRHSEVATAAPTRSPVTVVCSRAVLEPVGDSTNTLQQAGNLAMYLHYLNVNFEMVGRDQWTPTYNPSTKVLIFSPAEATPTQLGYVSTWINTGSGHTLILVGNSPWQTDVNSTDTTLFPFGSESTKSFTYGQLAWTGPTYVSGVPNMTPAVLDDTGATLIDQWVINTSSGQNQVLHILPAITASAPQSFWGLSGFASNVVAAAIQKAAAYGHPPGAPDPDIAPFAVDNSAWDFENFQVPGGHALVVWNLQQLLNDDKLINSYVGTQQDPQPAQDPEKLYSRVATATPNNPATIQNLQPNTSYYVYSVFNGGTPQLVSTDSNGNLTIQLNNSTDIFYYGLASCTLFYDPVHPTNSSTVKAVQAAWTRATNGY